MTDQGALYNDHEKYLTSDSHVLRAQLFYATSESSSVVALGAKKNDNFKALRTRFNVNEKLHSGIRN